jgi:hypothetical protein
MLAQSSGMVHNFGCKSKDRLAPNSELWFVCRAVLYQQEEEVSSLTSDNTSWIFTIHVIMYHPIMSYIIEGRQQKINQGLVHMSLYFPS